MLYQWLNNPLIKTRSIGYINKTLGKVIGML